MTSSFRTVSDVSRAVGLGRDLFEDRQREAAGLPARPARPAIPFRSHRALLSYADEQELLFHAKTKTTLSPEGLETYEFFLAKMRKSEQYQGKRFMLMFDHRELELFRLVVREAPHRKLKVWECYLVMRDNLRKGTPIIDRDRDELAEDLGVSPAVVSQLTSQLVRLGVVARVKERKTQLFQLLPREWQCDGPGELAFPWWRGDMASMGKALADYQADRAAVRTAVAAMPAGRRDEHPSLLQ